MCPHIRIPPAHTHTAHTHHKQLTHKTKYKHHTHSQHNEWCKETVFENAVRVPLIIRDPRSLRSTTTGHTPSILSPSILSPRPHTHSHTHTLILSHTLHPLCLSHKHTHAHTHTVTTHAHTHCHHMQLSKAGGVRTYSSKISTCTEHWPTWQVWMCMVDLGCVDVDV